MTSSLEAEGGVGQKMTCDDMMTHREARGGKSLMTKYPLFTEILAGSMNLKVMTSFMNSPLSIINYPTKNNHTEMKCIAGENPQKASVMGNT